MDALQAPESYFVSAAEGWLELGNIAEALAELTHIQETLQSHPEVLQVRWAICVHEKNWPMALEVSRALLELYPHLSVGWLHRAYAIRRVPEGGLQAAWDALFPVLEKFADTAIIPYNLACYACQMGQLDQARELLSRAIKTGRKNQIKQLALDDSDLKPLWPEIHEL
jgi:tetratricopeptide (TPR) repeat protein